MPFNERLNEGIKPETQPTLAVVPSSDSTEILASLPAPITRKDVLLAAGALTKRNILQANGLPVADRELLNRVDEEVYNPNDWKKGRVVGPREDVVALREDAMFRIARFLMSEEKGELPEDLRGPAVSELLDHVSEFIGVDGNLEALTLLIGNPQKADILVHESHDIHHFELPKLPRPVSLPTVVTIFTPTRVTQDS